MKEINDFIDIHKGESIVVCGCGTSVAQFKDYSDKFVTIGVNDIGRLFDPDYLVVLNDIESFSGDRFFYVKENNAHYVFTHIKNLAINEPEKLVKLKLGRFRALDLNNKYKSGHIIDYSTNSPYVACVLAYYMGAKNIGLIGVDFTENHFFAETGNHSLSARLPKIVEEYKMLSDALHSNGVGLYNLSPTSKIGLTKISIDEFREKN
jgi:hypothetical protein